jgi:Tol biopolymer transport system component
MISRNRFPRVGLRDTVALGLAFAMAAVPLGSVTAEPQVGTSRDDLIVGLGGPSRIKGKAGDDVIVGDPAKVRGLGNVRGTYRASTAGKGAQGNGGSILPSFSPDGKLVAFESDSSNLVSGDRNGDTDSFVKNIVTGAITRLSVNAKGAEGNSDSFSPIFSADGTKVVFRSNASNLVPGDTNKADDIFVKVLATGKLTRASSRANGAVGAGASFSPVFSPDGTKVAFTSRAENLVAGDTNKQADIFVKDLGTGAIQLVSTTASGAQANDDCYTAAFSPDGTKIAFSSDATNLVAGDTNGKFDIFVKDLTSGAIQRVSTTGAGGQSNGDSLIPVFSPDGTRIAFRSAASNLVGGDSNAADDIFVKTLATGAIQRVSTTAGGGQANGGSAGSVFSADSKRIMFSSEATNLVPKDTNGVSDVFVKVLATGAIQRVSTRPTGGQASGASSIGGFSPDGSKVTFSSSDGTLVAGDTNKVADIFVADLTAKVAGNDVLQGGPGDDELYGGAGNDTLAGEDGKDEVTGGPGDDTFLFASKLGAGNVDRIVDLDPAKDVIALSKKVFQKAGDLGALPVAAFKSGKTDTATAPGQRIIYNSNSGALLYDPDGSGKTAAVQFAEVKAGTALTAATFLVVK